MHTQRRYATCPQGMSKKKRERKRKYSPYQKHYKGKRINIKEFSSIIHQKYPHTCTSWSRLITCKMWEAGCLYILHTYRSTKKKPLEVGWKKRKAHKKGLGEEWNTLSDPRDHLRNYNISFQKLYKTSGLTVEQRSGKWYSNSRSDPQPPKMRMML